MGRLKLAVLDGDEEYLANFEKYLVANYPQRFEILTFTSAEKLHGYLSGRDTACFGHPDILAVNGLLHEESLRAGGAGVYILLAGDEEGCLPESITHVNKYQHMESLVAEMMRHYASCCLKGRSPAFHGKTRIIGVFSPSGGTGKSCIAAGCSILCAGGGSRVFYLNLECIPSTGLFFHGCSEQSFSNVIYHLKGDKRNLSLKLESARCVDEATGVHFYRPPANICEMCELSESEIRCLIDEFRKGGVYDVVFVDMRTGFDALNLAILENSDVILAVLANDLRTSIKLDSLASALRLLERKRGAGFAARVIPVLNMASAYAGERGNCGFAGLSGQAGQAGKGFYPGCPGYGENSGIGGNDGIDGFFSTPVRIRDCDHAASWAETPGACPVKNSNFMSDLKMVLGRITPDIETAGNQDI